MTKHSEELAQSRPQSGAALTDRIDDKLAGLLEWLHENAPGISDDQKHLDAGSAERAYWHYGYAVALRDIRNCLAGKNDRLN